MEQQPQQQLLFSDDIWREIARHMQLGDLFSLERTCRAICTALRNRGAWFALSERDFGNFRRCYTYEEYLEYRELQRARNKYNGLGMSVWIPPDYFVHRTHLFVTSNINYAYFITHHFPDMDQGGALPQLVIREIDGTQTIFPKEPKFALNVNGTFGGAPFPCETSFLIRYLKASLYRFYSMPENLLLLSKIARYFFVNHRNLTRVEYTSWCSFVQEARFFFHYGDCITRRISYGVENFKKVLCKIANHTNLEIKQVSKFC